MNKLAIISTHPIQYNAPFFKLLTERNNIKIKVFYTWSQSENNKKYDPGFDRIIAWDIPLLDGYDYLFIENISKNPGSHHYNGINNPTLFQEIESWGATAILVYGWNFKSHLKTLKYFKNKIPVLFRGDSTLLDEKNVIKKILRRLFLRYIYSYVDIALYTGKANNAYFKAHGFYNDNLVWMPHAVENKRFQSSQNIKQEAQLIKKLLLIPNDALVFLFAGKLEHKKQPELLLDVFCQLAENSTILLIVGNGIMQKELKEKYFNHPQVRFLDFVNQRQMPSIYACGDVFILPSKGPGETWGLSINEAMAAGKAVITSNACGAFFDLIIQERNGFVFKKNNPETLKSCMEYFIKNKFASEEMGQQSLKIVQEFSFENGCIAIEKVFLNKIKNK